MKKRTFADALAEHRKASGLSLRDVAERMIEAEEAGHGRAVSHAALARYEREKRMPGADVLECLAHVYDVEIGELFPTGGCAA